MSFHAYSRPLLVPLAALLLAGCSPDESEADANAAAQSSDTGESNSAGKQAEGTLISGTVDGQPASWSLWAIQSDFTGDANTGTVSVMARKVNGPEDIGAIAFGFELSDGQPNIPEVTLDNGEGKRSFYLAPSSPSPLTLNKVEKSGEQLHLSGSLSAKLANSQDFGRTIDEGNSHAVDLTFDIKLDQLRL